MSGMARQNVLFVLCMFMVHAVMAKELIISTPPGVTVSSAAGTLTSNPAIGDHHIDFPSDIQKTPIEIEFFGPYGGRVKKRYFLKNEKNFMTLNTGITSVRASNPNYLRVLPALCPRVDESAGHLLYAAQQDLLNQVPTLHFLDADAQHFADIQEVARRFDCKDVVLVDSAKVTFDYEDPSLFKAELADGTKIWETESGFYANFHIAVLPFQERLVAMPPRELLRVAQGKVSEAGIAPEPSWMWRTHSFLPGPYMSHKDLFYTLCEWGDTAVQAPVQELMYTDFAVWDWDYPVGDTVLVVVWEGDEEEALVSKGYLERHTIIDDLVGIFKVTRKELAKGKLFVNEQNNFWLRLRTGDLEQCQ